MNSDNNNNITTTTRYLNDDELGIIDLDGGDFTEEIKSNKQEVKNDTVQYLDYIARSKNFKSLEIKYTDIDSFDFNHKAFFEVISSPVFVHPYFDFDEITEIDDLYEVIDWLDGLSKLFGKYSIGGYTTIKEVSDEVGLKLLTKDNANHDISFHVVFYQKKILSTDMKRIMTHKEGKGFSYNGIHKYCDPNVYKIVSRYEDKTTRQLLRHPLSAKIHHPNPNNDNSKKNRDCRGSMINGSKPSYNIVTVHGDEPTITKEELDLMFSLKELPKAKRNPDYQLTKPNTNVNQQQELITTSIGDNFIADFSLIELNCDELYELLCCFDPEYDNLQLILPILYHSPYKQDFLEELLEKWYMRRDHTNGCPVKNFSKYYEQELSNKWYFSLLKHLNEKDCRQYLRKYAKQKVDESVSFNIKGDFSLDDLRQKDYSSHKQYGINVGEFLTDLKQVLVFINSGKPLFIIKEHSNNEDNTYKLSYLNHKELSVLLNSIYLGKYIKDGKERDITAFTIFNAGKNKNIFMKSAISFYSDNPRMFSYYQGYDYNIVNEVKLDLIQPILTHIHDVIADNNDDVNEYILSWISYIMKNPKAKTEVALVINSEQGTGKNRYFTNLICKMLGIYATPNLNNLDYLTGHFNAMLENKKLIVCNEISSADTNKYFNADTLKSILTEERMLINQKLEPVREVENVVNLIIVSNHVAPVKIERSDRRYMVTTASNKYVGNIDYFNNLEKVISHPDFYEQLFTFFMTRDISSWNSRNIPVTEPKETIRQASLSPFELFIQRHKKEFVEGYIKDDSYKDFFDWAKDDIHLTNIPNKITFNKHIRSYCSSKQLRRNGSRQYCYVLNEEYISRFNYDNSDNDMDDFDLTAKDEIAREFTG